MNSYEDSTDRGPLEYFLFAFGFGGFMTAAGGVVLSLPGLALTGLMMLVLSVAALARWTER